MKYEVTIPYTSGPWYTGYAEAENPVHAMSLVLVDAVKAGFSGKHKKIKVREVKS